MKKMIIMLLALSMAAALAACGNNGEGSAETQEETAGQIPAETEAEATEETAPELSPEDEYAGAWYASVNGAQMVLDLDADGTYIISYAGGEEEGSWSLSDGTIVLEADETAVLSIRDGRLYWPGMNVYFSREVQAAGAYSPADVITDIDPEVMNGYWKSMFVETEGTIFPASSVNDVTDVYIEAPRAALGGPLFGDVIVEMTSENGALTFGEGGLSVTLALQEDGLMRMTLVNDGNEMILYLEPAGPIEDE